MEDEAEIYDGIRAQFPLTFGKQSKSQTSLESIHKATRRTDPAANAAESDGETTSRSLPALSAGSRSWIESVKGKGNTKRPKQGHVGPSQVEVEEEGGLIGPPRPEVRMNVEEEDGVMVGPPRPPAGMNVSDEDQEEEEEDRGMIRPPRPPEGVRIDDSDEDEEEEEEEDDGNRFRIPLSNEIILKGHTKVVSALAVDHTGSRVLSGSYDYSVRMTPSSSIELKSNIRIYDRDGLTIGEFIKGDMYIRDLKNTKGHISGLTCGEWHPKTKETILTSSEDGSLRIWDVNDFKSQKQVIKPKLQRPGRVPVTTCAWDREGKSIAGGIGDGSIQVWNIKPGWGSRPDIHVEKAHSDDITGLKFSSDGCLLLSRSFDSTLKVWDLRQMKQSLKVFDELPNNYAQTNVSFSPDEQLILTGTSVERESSTGGLLCFYDREKLELVSRVGISPTYSVVQCAWHPKLNQVFATVGDKSQGGTHVLYDPTLSERGALVCVARAPRKKSVDDFEVNPVIHNPHALPLFRDQPSRKRQREKMLKDPFKSHKPEVPINGPGHGGRTGTTKGSLLTQYLLKQGGMLKETWMEEDPREAILKYADVAAKDPKFIAPAYAETQPQPVFAKSDSEEEE
ncbi:WD repeat-containing protein [Drosera capensis]